MLAFRRNDPTRARLVNPFGYIFFENRVSKRTQTELHK